MKPTTHAQTVCCVTLDSSPHQMVLVNSATLVTCLRAQAHANAASVQQDMLQTQPRPSVSSVHQVHSHQMVKHANAVYQVQSPPTLVHQSVAHVHLAMETQLHL